MLRGAPAPKIRRLVADELGLGESAGPDLVIRSASHLTCRWCEIREAACRVSILDGAILSFLGPNLPSKEGSSRYMRWAHILLIFKREPNELLWRKEGFDAACLRVHGVALGFGYK